MRMPILYLLFCVAATAAPSFLRASDSKPLNIVVFLVDDMGIMDTSVPFLTDGNSKAHRYPLNEFYRTPNMEQLAARGVRFSNFYAMSVCSPTRVTLMTGQNAARHRTTNWINPDVDNVGPQGPPAWNWSGLKKDDVTLAKLLQAQGYRTIHIGKGHFGPIGSDGANPLNLGFDVNVGGTAQGAPGSYYAHKDFSRANQDNPRKVPHLQKYHGQDIFLTEALTIEANAHISDAVHAGRPFFLYFSHYAAHAPFQSDPRFAANYQDSGKPASAQAFATLIEGMDKSLGDVLSQLDALGVAENTLVVFLGDNGSDAPLGQPHQVACAAPLRGKKGSHYEGGMRVPMIAAWAKNNTEQSHQQRLPIAAGAIQTQIASVCDLFPTIIKMLNLDLPANYVLDGASLGTLFSGEIDRTRNQKFLMHYPHAPHRSDYFTVYLNDQWKVIYHYFPSPASENSHYQLYNLAQDPFEQNNLATSKPVKLRHMMTDLVAALESHQAVYPVQDSRPQKPVVP